MKKHHCTKSRKSETDAMFTLPDSWFVFCTFLKIVAFRIQAKILKKIQETHQNA